MLFRTKTIDDLVGFTEICDSERLLSVIGSECSPGDMKGALTDEQLEKQAEDIDDWLQGHEDGPVKD